MEIDMSKNTSNLPAGNAEKKKWWTKRKMIAAIVIGVALIGAAVAIPIMVANSVRPLPSTKEESRVVGTVGDYEVKYEELRFLTVMHRTSLDRELGKYEELDAEARETYERELEARVMSDITKNYAVLSLCDQYGIDTDSKDVRSEVKNGMKDYVRDSFGGSMKDYKAWLAANGVTDSVMRFNYKINVLENVLLNYFVENGIDIDYDGRNVNEFIDYVMEGEDWARTIHVFYPESHPYTTEEAKEAFIAQQLTQGSLSDAAFKDMKDAWKVQLTEQADRYNGKGAEAYAKETADALSLAYNDEERYSAIKKEIGKAPYVSGFSMDSSVSGIYFTYGQMGESYEGAAFGLSAYGTSEAIKTEDGYYVIMRLPLEEEDVRDQLDTLLVQYQYAAMKKHVDAKNAALSFTGNEYFESLALTDVK